jgi:hypothetical protein
MESRYHVLTAKTDTIIEMASAFSTYPANFLGMHLHPSGTFDHLIIEKALAVLTLGD